MLKCKIHFSKELKLKKRVFSKNCIFELCSLLQDTFGEPYSFKPLQRSEGGIEVTKWPGQNLNMKANGFYEQSKTLRFVTLDTDEWPLSVEDEWKKNLKKNKDIVFKQNDVARSYMRFSSLNVKFSKKEMLMIRKCVDKLDMIIVENFIHK